MNPAHNRIAEFRAGHPDLFLLEETDLPGIERHLQRRGVLDPAGQLLSAQKAGDGNMNKTVRVATSRGSTILKQSRPWVEKYPQFDAPWDRASHEADFYRITSTTPGVAGVMPCLLDFDPENRILVLQDLGAATDYSGIYSGGIIAPADLHKMAQFLSCLHGGFIKNTADQSLSNASMRELNHAHIFDIPLRPHNGLDLDKLTPGLAAAAEALKSDANYTREVSRIGQEFYLREGRHLVHGDFFPGSVLKTSDGPKVIDPEFCHFGRPELDVAVFLAHLLLADQSSDCRSHWIRSYTPSSGFDERLMLQLTGIEIMRRLVGYAQLPLSCCLDQKKQLLALSRSLVLSPDLQLVDCR